MISSLLGDESSSFHAVANGDFTGQEKAQLGLFRNEGEIVSAKRKKEIVSAQTPTAGIAGGGFTPVKIRLKQP